MRIVGATLILAVLAGCSDSNAPASINGTYRLRTYRYEPLPGLVRETDVQSIRITGGSITLEGDLTFHSSYSFEQNYNGTVSTSVAECDGQWQPTETSPQGGQMITLTQTSSPTCYDHGIGEWDHHNHLNLVWVILGDTQHGR